MTETNTKHEPSALALKIATELYQFGWFETTGDTHDSDKSTVAEIIDAELAPLVEALDAVLPDALAHLQRVYETTPESENETEDGIPPAEEWELSRRYYAARAALDGAE